MDFYFYHCPLCGERKQLMEATWSFPEMKGGHDVSLSICIDCRCKVSRLNKEELKKLLDRIFMDNLIQQLEEETK